MLPQIDRMVIKTRMLHANIDEIAKFITILLMTFGD